MIREHYCTSPAEAEEFIGGMLTAVLGGKGKSAVLLSGGRSIHPVLSALKNADRNLLADMNFFLADERVGSDFNQIMLRDRLFGELVSSGTVKEEQLQFPDISRPPEEAAAAYAGILPEIDIAFLGVGEDGHVASLFPGHAALRSDRLVEVVSNSPKPPPRRITLTFQAFSENTVVMLLFFGESKKNAYTTFKKTDSFWECPAVYFKQAATAYLLHDQE